MLYTFIIETGGATLVRQFSGESAREALLAWSRSAESQATTDFEHLLQEDGPTPVAGLKHVWCSSSIDRNDVFHLVHIVATNE
jgi:hypothetical protein